MASLLFAAGILSYDAIKSQNQKRKTRRSDRTTAFFALERENAARIANLQSTSCFCQQSDWRGGGCDAHGYVPAAGEVGGPPLYMEFAPAESAEGYEYDARAERRQTMPPEYLDVNAPHAPVGAEGERGSPYVYQRGREEGFLASRPASFSAVGAGEGGRVPGAMGEEEVRRINAERRKRMRAGGFTGLVRRWRRERPVGGVEGVGVVR